MTNIDFQAKIFKALGHPVRLKILKKLVSGELCVCKLVDDTEFTQANLSQHLKVLSNAGLISRRKEGNYSHYRISDTRTIDLLVTCEDVATSYIKKLL